MLKTVLKYLIEVAVILSIGQIPAGKTTVGGEFVSRVSDLAQYAWKAIGKKTKNMSIKDMASSPEELSDSDREQMKAFLSRDE